MSSRNAVPGSLTFSSPVHHTAATSELIDCPADSISEDLKVAPMGSFSSNELKHTVANGKLIESPADSNSGDFKVTHMDSFSSNELKHTAANGELTDSPVDTASDELQLLSGKIHVFPIDAGSGMHNALYEDPRNTVQILDKPVCLTFKDCLMFNHGFSPWAYYRHR